MKPPAAHPCGSCPYRKDVPSGIWAVSEYRKLPAYDGETHDQPHQVFLCHQNNDRVCAGWCGTHDMQESLAVRLASFNESPEVIAAIMDYKTSTPLFVSGRAACNHGVRDIKQPGVIALAVMKSVIRRRSLEQANGSERRKGKA